MRVGEEQQEEAASSPWWGVSLDLGYLRKGGWGRLSGARLLGRQGYQRPGVSALCLSLGPRQDVGMSVC